MSRITHAKFPKACIKYFETGPWPVFIGLAKDDQAFDKEMARLGVKNPPPFVSDNAGATTHILRCDGNTTIIVCIKPFPKGVSKEQVAALVAHEAVHVWQATNESMGEEHSPEGEHEAYGVQWVMQSILEELWRKP